MQGCYLLHFSDKLHHARHYLGYSSNLKARIAGHEAGNSAKLISAITRHDIKFVVARVWIDGDRALERRLKNQHNGPKLCPICQGLVGPGWSIDTKKLLFVKAPPCLTSHQGKRQPMNV